MKNLLLINCNILNGTREMEVIKNSSILISDGKISKIGIFDKPENVKIIDLKGKYILPGLINLHSHLPSSGKLSKKKLGDKSKLVKLISSNFIFKKIGLALDKKYALMTLNSGVTTVRAVGGVSDLDSTLRDKINSNKMIGPRIITSNTAIGVKGGHMDGTVAKSVSSSEEADKVIDNLLIQKVDLLKLMITGGVLDGKEPGHPAPLNMNLDLVKFCCEKAHKNGLKVAAHVESPEGMEVAVKGGVDSIEHGSLFSEKLIPLMKDNKTFCVMTISPALPFAKLNTDIHGYGEIAAINSEIVLKGIIDCANKCLKNNIPVGLGTDAGSTLISHYNFYKELLYFVKYCNVTNKFALYSATLGNATLLGLDNETGSIEVGKMADMIVVDDNPLENLNTLGSVKHVFIKGHFIKKPRFKHDKTIDNLVSLY